MILAKRRRKPFIRWAAGLALVFGFISTGQAQTEKPITGSPRVLEGDLLRVGDTLVRLYAIDAPEMKQTCEGKTRIYPCGAVAATGLMDLTAGLTSVTCQPRGKTVDGVIIALCTDPQGFDLSRQMLYTGWALALPDAEIAFHRIQEEAQQAKRGLWAGHVERPWRWRPEPTAN
ncbi:MAG: thermonuclease family protein [Rhodospirillales bacterium]|nr:thermonuclease family protein [Rhodospirillales bacterium]